MQDWDKVNKELFSNTTATVLYILSAIFTFIFCLWITSLLWSGSVHRRNGIIKIWGSWSTTSTTYRSRSISGTNWKRHRGPKLCVRICQAGNVNLLTMGIEQSQAQLPPNFPLVSILLRNTSRFCQVIILGVHAQTVSEALLHIGPFFLSLIIIRKGSAGRDALDLLHKQLRIAKLTSLWTLSRKRWRLLKLPWRGQLRIAKIVTLWRVSWKQCHLMEPASLEVQENQPYDWKSNHHHIILKR